MTLHEAYNAALDRRVAELAGLEEGEHDSVGYFCGYLDAIAFARKLARNVCGHEGGTVLREVCEDCGTAFP